MEVQLSYSFLTQNSGNKLEMFNIKLYCFAILSILVFRHIVYPYVLKDFSKLTFSWIYKRFQQYKLQEHRLVEIAKHFDCL